MSVAGWDSSRLEKWNERIQGRRKVSWKREAGYRMKVRFRAASQASKLALSATLRTTRHADNATLTQSVISRRQCKAARQRYNAQAGLEFFSSASISPVISAACNLLGSDCSKSNRPKNSSIHSMASHFSYFSTMLIPPGLDRGRWKSL